MTGLTRSTALRWCSLGAVRVSPPPPWLWGWGGRGATHGGGRPTAKDAAKQAKAVRAADRTRKARLKTRSEHIAETQAAFNALVRYRDRNETCISCPAVLATLADQPGGGYDCGHFRSRGSAPHLRFDFRNAHGQCKKCNRYRSGNAADYRIGLIGRIGLAAVEALECDQTGGDWTIHGLIAMRADFRAKLRALKEAA